jgi:hypothetical protein
MSKYRTISKEVDAVQVTPDMIQDIENFPDWAKPYLDKNGKVVRVLTSIGPLSVFVADYLVLHSPNDIFPYSPDHFHKQFEGGSI